MASLDGAPWGNFRGTIGNLTFRVIEGKTYIYAQNGRYTIPQDETSVGIRNKFRYTGQIYSAMGQVFWLKFLWKNSTAKGRYFHHKLSSTNYYLVEDDGSFNNIHLVPPDAGFSLFPINDFNFTLNSEEVLLDAIVPEDTAAKNLRYPWVSAQGVMRLSGASDLSVKPFRFIPLTAKNEALQFDTPVQFRAELSGNDKILIQHYSERHILMNLIFKNVDDVPMNASANLSCTIIDENIIPMESALLFTAGVPVEEETIG